MGRGIAARVSLSLLWACGACLRLTVLAVPPVIYLIQQDLNLSGTEVGMLSGIPVAVFACFAAPGSIVVARIGVRGALLCGLAAATAGTLLRMGVSNAWQLYLTSILMSAGIGIMQPSMAAAVREWLPRRSAFGTAVYTNGLIMGEIIPVATMLSFLLPYFAGMADRHRRVGSSFDSYRRGRRRVRSKIGDEPGHQTVRSVATATEKAVELAYRLDARKRNEHLFLSQRILACLPERGRIPRIHRAVLDGAQRRADTLIVPNAAHGRQVARKALALFSIGCVFLRLRGRDHGLRGSFDSVLGGRRGIFVRGRALIGPFDCALGL